jgi:hypothetical protein
MKVHFTSADGTSKTVEIDVTTLSDEQLNVYASLGSEEAADELKSRIGFNPYKPLEKITDKDVEDYSKWSESQKKEGDSEDER